MNGEGIMNLPAGVGGATSQDGLDSFAPLIASQQAARDMGYPRFTRELLAAGSEIDPAEVQEFLQAIRDAGLTADDVALMRRVVEAVFNDPNNYPEVRQTLLQEGVPEDLLPETFDLEFFTALRMAVEEAENLAREPRPMDQAMPMPMEGASVEMAEGGIVGLPELKPIARAMASMGRQGDTMLAHITPQEAMMLKRMGGSGSINPYTGLPEFFIGKLFKGVVKAVKKFAKSTIGRAVTSIALGAFLGPAAAGFLGVSSAAGVAAVSGALGGFGSSVLAGDGIKNALRSGLTGAVLAGGITGITGGSAAFQARPELQAAYNQQGFLGTVQKTAQNYFGAPVDTARQMYGAPETAAPATGTTTQAPIGTATDISRVTPPTDAISAQTANAPFLQKAVDPTTLNYADQAFGTPTSLNVGERFAMPGVAPSSVDVNLGAPFPSSGVTGGAERGFFDKTVDFFSPSAREAAGNQVAANEYSRVLADTGSQKLAEAAYTKALPGTLSKYGPMAAAGIGTLVATGAMGSPFEVPEQQPGESYEAYMARRDAAKQAFREERPEFYGSFVPSYYSQPSQPVYTAARGSGPEGVENFPRKNGHISGPGTGTSDDIPAMLSDGEFVFTAKAVRNMGNGSRRKGAAKMYKLMKMLEGGPVGKVA